MSFPQPEWAAISNLTPPSRWADLADRIALVEHAITSHREQLLHTLDRMQDLPAVAESDDLWQRCEDLRLGADRLPTDVGKLDELLSELFNEFGPKVKNSHGQRFVRWREGPWYTLAPRSEDD